MARNKNILGQSQLYQRQPQGWRKLIRVNIWSHLSYSTVITACLLGLTATSGAATKQADVELKIGIVQRFGDEPTDELNLQATPGDRLNLKFKTGERQQVLLNASSVKLEVVMQPLTAPALEERVVLSTHQSFETAEDAAKQWHARGIEVEIAQPQRWQVWAKRQVYNTPLLRRLLLQSIRIKGNKTAYLDTQILQQVPQVSWMVNGTRYRGNQLDITADKK